MALRGRLHDRWRAVAGLLAVACLGLLPGFSPRASADAPAGAGAKALPTDPEGEFTASVDNAAVDMGCGLWVLTGHYTTTLAANGLSLDLVHYGSGKVIGSGSYTYGAITVPLTAVGRASGADGEVAVSLTLRGVRAATATADGLRVVIRMRLVLDDFELAMTGDAIVVRNVIPYVKPVDDDEEEDPDTKSVSTVTCTLELPEGVDGTYSIDFYLVERRGRVIGEAVLILPNGDDIPLLVRGQPADDLALLAVRGDPSAPAARGIKVTTGLATFDDGSADLYTFTGRLFGQTLAW